MWFYSRTFTGAGNGLEKAEKATAACYSFSFTLHADLQMLKCRCDSLSLISETLSYYLFTILHHLSSFPESN